MISSFGRAKHLIGWFLLPLGVNLAGSVWFGASISTRTVSAAYTTLVSSRSRATKLHSLLTNRMCINVALMKTRTCIFFITRFLRLRQAFPYVTRVLPKPITLHGYTIAKGVSVISWAIETLKAMNSNISYILPQLPIQTCMIMANQISSHREENFEEPDKFKPERWLSGNTECDQHQKFSCLPFGYGIRSCLGKHMAETEIMLLTAKVSYEYLVHWVIN